ncbi:MAG: FkbM family methyltransferase [Lachnospiraceae bacterium]|nr:FkbM family methyltransferase [Lachnospiraceae bacterium]
MKHLDFNDTSSYRTRDAIIADLKSDGLPVALYGAGQIGREAAKLFMDNGIEDISFIETEDYLFPGKQICIAGKNIDCISAGEMIGRHDKFNVVLSVVEDTLLPKLKEIFPMAHHIDHIDAHAPHRMERDFLVNNAGIIREIYDSLCDEESKDVFEAFLHARYTGDVGRISSLCREGYLYDWELLGLCADDTVMDGGAYIGDTAAEMEKYLGTLPKKVFCFEPDEKNIAEIRKTYGMTKAVVPVCAGLYSRDDILSFSGGGSIGSSLSDDGEDRVSVTAPDLHDEYRDVTVIKMDIEGSEPEALAGMARLIGENHPRLAVCIYHNNDDVIKIYSELKRYGYRFYMRQHSHSCEETVLYAV